MRRALQEPDFGLHGGKRTSYLPQTCRPCIIYAFKNSLSSVFLPKKFSQFICPCQRKRGKQSSQHGISNHRNQSSSFIPTLCVLLLLRWYWGLKPGVQQTFFFSNLLWKSYQIQHAQNYLGGLSYTSSVTALFLLISSSKSFLMGYVCISAIQWYAYIRNYQWLSIELDCPGKWWSHYSWKCSRNGWMWHSMLWFSWCGGVQRWDSIFEIFSNFIILWLWKRKRLRTVMSLVWR